MSMPWEVVEVRRSHRLQVLLPADKSQQKPEDEDECQRRRAA